MTDEEATAVATALDGEAWQSGGEIWSVALRRQDGRLVVVSDDANGSASARSGLLLHSTRKRYRHSAIRAVVGRENGFVGVRTDAGVSWRHSVPQKLLARTPSLSGPTRTARPPTRTPGSAGSYRDEEK